MNRSLLVARRGLCLLGSCVFGGVVVVIVVLWQIEMSVRQYCCVF